MSGSSSLWTRWRAFIAVLAIAAATVLMTTPAHAAPVAPSGLTPAGSSVTTNPVLSWNRVGAASSYDVEVAGSSDFSTPIYQVNTTNRRATPTTQLPMTQIWWRVRARNTSGTSRWTVASFTRGKLAGPIPQSPTDGSLLKQPVQPPLLRWSPVAGATTYTVEVDRGATADWVDTQNYSTQTTSLVVPDPQENGEYWWRVRAEIGAGQSTHPSTALSYRVGPLPAVTGTTPASAAAVEEVVLEWQPVDGAVSYDIRVSTDNSFNEIIDQAVVAGTRYSPEKSYDVDDYWWQVRARNIFGKAKEWVDVQERHQFRRTWEGTGARPELLHPANVVSPDVGDDFYYQWTPSRLATRYRLDVGTDPSFSPGSFQSCFTTQTTYTPGFVHPGKPADNCMPDSKVTYYWRVKALDSWKGEASEQVTSASQWKQKEIQGIYSDIHTFTYSPGSVRQIAPLNGATVDIPTLRWEPALDAVKYEVQLKWSSGQLTATTYSTSWTPTGTQKLDHTKGPFTWTVRAIDHNGKKSPLPVFGAGQQFHISGSIPTTGAAPLTPLSPTATSPASSRFPELTWEPVANAAYYQIAVGTAGSGGVYLLPEKFPYPAATDISDKYLAAGSYDWVVAGFTSTGAELPVAPGQGTFTVAELETVAGHRAALEGLTFRTGATCDKSLLTGSDGICDMRATPVLDWKPVPGVGYYMVYLSRDRNFQNMVYGSYSNSLSIPTTTNTMWTPMEALDESQAGVAYYWYIRPCKAAGKCAPDPLRADHAFAKKSHRVEALSPVVRDGVVPTVKNSVTFDWVDYLETNQKATLANPVTGEAPAQAARSYHIQVDDSPSFPANSLVDDVIVDQTTYTAVTRLFPEGQLYWRVQAIDGSGNGLSWSEAMEFRKSSPRPTPSTPVGAVSGTQPLRWEPAPSASSYDLDIYRNADTAASASNKVYTQPSKQVAYTLTAPLPGGNYVWRVRREDLSGHKGQWSGWASFQVGGSTPVLAAPSTGAWVRRNDSLFTWRATPEAVTYLYERRAVGATYNTESVYTASTAWAPNWDLATGRWEWRVSSLDASGKVIRASAWRTFSVDATGPTVVTVRPSGYSVAATANLKVKFSEPVLNASRTTITLSKQGARKRLSARVTLSADRRTATLNPSLNLRRGTYYTLAVSQAVTDRQGNRLQWPYSATLRTR